MHRVVLALAVVVPLSAHATVRSILRAGDAFPGGTVSTIQFWDADGSAQQIAIAVYGTIPSRPGKHSALLRWHAGQLTTLALEGDPLPGGQSMTVVINPKIDGAGRVAFSYQ